MSIKSIKQHLEGMLSAGLGHSKHFAVGGEMGSMIIGISVGEEGVKRKGEL